MPGIIGYVKNNLKLDINKMTEATLNMKKVVQGESYSDLDIAITETKLNFSDNIPIIKEDFVVFVNGTLYNLNEVNSKFDISANNIEELLYEASKQNILEQVLNKVDGIFQAVIYDRLNKNLKLVTDRFGVRFIYYYFKDGKFAFSSEVKSLLDKSLDLSLDKNAFNSFMNLGFMYDDITWFKNIRLIKPSSILEYDLKTQTLNQKYYWKYSEIEQQNISYQDSVNKLAPLFERAIAKRFNPKDKIMVPVSGGLDSRMIAAAFSKLKKVPNLHFSTFGQKGCRDIEIAQKIAKILKQKHSAIYIGNDEDVIKARQNLIWSTDGIFSIQHMHGMDKLENSYADEITTIFHGTAGGEIYGCVYHPMDDKWGALPSKENYYHMYGKLADEMNIDSDYYQIPQFHPVVMCNSLRRFGYNSLQYMLGRFNLCLPFLDNELMECIFSIPEEYRKDYKLYFDALKKAFPYWYTKIPFQSAGGFNPETRWQKRKRKLMAKIRKIFKIHEQWHYFDYLKYIQSPNTQLEMEKILNTKNNFISTQGEDFISKYKNENWENIRFNPDLALKLITVKLYFDKIEEILK